MNHEQVHMTDCQTCKINSSGILGMSSPKKIHEKIFRVGVWMINQHSRHCYAILGDEEAFTTSIFPEAYATD